LITHICVFLFSAAKIGKRRGFFQEQLTWILYNLSLLSGKTIAFPFLRSSRAGFSFFSTAKKRKQKMPSLKENL
jgi:hypothetical protein